MRSGLGRRAVAICCCGLLLVMAPGCSFVFVRGAPSEPPMDPVPTARLECTESAVAPAVDTVLGVMSAVGAMIGIAGYAQGCDPPPKPGQWEILGRCWDRNMSGGIALAAGIPALVLLGSAVYGYVKTSRCRQVNAAIVACQSADLDACQWLSPPPPPARLDRGLEGDRCTSDGDCGTDLICRRNQCRR